MGHRVRRVSRFGGVLLMYDTLWTSKQCVAMRQGNYICVFVQQLMTLSVPDYKNLSKCVYGLKLVLIFLLEVTHISHLLLIFLHEPKRIKSSF